VPANEMERERWNDERRTTVWPKRELLTDEVTPLLLAAASPQPGERIVDVGCGGGRSSLAAGRAVGAEGAVVGVDVSRGLLRLAEERRQSAGAANLSFVLADAQTDSFPGGPFDAAISQFGVMFFDDPVAAFANIRSQLRPGGRLAFACWQPLHANPWFFLDAVSPFVPPAPPPEPGSVATGPFVLADPVRTTAILEDAGFARVAHEAHELEAEAPEDSVLDDLQLSSLRVPEERLGEARAAAREHLAQFRISEGRWRFPIAFFIFTASTG
jgi:SAM-dependent methyltransferase